MTIFTHNDYAITETTKGLYFWKHLWKIFANLPEIFGYFFKKLMQLFNALWCY